MSQEEARNILKSFEGGKYSSICAKLNKTFQFLDKGSFGTVFCLGDGTVVKVHVNTNDLEIDDEVPDGRLDYKLPGKSYKVIKAEIVK